VIDLPVTAVLQAAWAVREAVDAHPRFLAFLPAAHVSHQLINVFAVTLLGGEVCFGSGGGIGRDPEQLVTDLRESQPTVLFGSPQLFAEVVEEARRTLQRGVLGRVIWRRLEVQTQRSLERGVITRSPSVTGRIIGRQLRKSLGLRQAHDMFSGTAPLDATLHAFLGAVGWFVRNTYGLSECGGAATVSGPDRMTPGELGGAVEGIDLKTDTSGQLWLRGPSLMKGYLGRSPLTAGDWLPTGDLVQPSSRGTFCFHARMSSLVPIPAGRTTLDEVERAANQVYAGVTAVAVADEDRTVSLFLFTGADEMHTVQVGPEITAPELECVRRVAIVPDAPSAARHEIGPTGKVRRWVICAHWKHHLRDRAERAEAGPPESASVTVESVSL
jgi:long-chain acyl-CoA synthetase